MVASNYPVGLRIAYPPEMFVSQLKHYDAHDARRCGHNGGLRVLAEVHGDGGCCVGTEGCLAVAAEFEALLVVRPCLIQNQRTGE